MPSAKAILAELKPLGLASYKKVMLNHGVREPFFGVKIEALKKIQGRIKRDYRLALELFDTGNYDAQYLAGLIAEDEQMTKADLQHWVDQAYGPLIGSTVPWVAAGSPHGWEIAREWIDSTREDTAAAGWATLSSLVSIKEDAALDLPELKRLLQRVQRSILKSPNAVRKQMNHFVISVGCYVAPLSTFAKEAGQSIGPVTIDVGKTSCKVPFSPDYIAKAEKRGTIGKKRPTAKC